MVIPSVTGINKVVLSAVEDGMSSVTLVNGEVTVVLSCVVISINSDVPSDCAWIDKVVEGVSSLGLTVDSDSVVGTVSVVEKLDMVEAEFERVEVTIFESVVGT